MHNRVYNLMEILKDIEEYEKTSILFWNRTYGGRGAAVSCYPLCSPVFFDNDNEKQRETIRIGDASYEVIAPDQIEGCDIVYRVEDGRILQER